ncbi:ski7p [Saccharomyces arboricola H-6]|uniref:Ski7p n=1 Tax=Saccharomyces arboricola (strain H-6 / AS 2.3317 / CBS 10644) TaxID=1160507 RepID=J8PZ42_SACAR|nr:ski7p [Saccharomyces arboricola H-6]
MSLLEQLARKRLEKSKGPSSTVQSQTTSKGASLLERLHKNREVKDANGEYKKKDLRTLLSKDKIKKIDGAPNQHTFTLSSKLSALKKSNSDLDTKGKSAVSETTECQSSAKRKPSNVVLSYEDSWNVINEINCFCSLKGNVQINQTDDFTFTKFLVNRKTGTPERPPSYFSLEKQYDELFTVFQPSSLPKTSRDKAIENFSNPSPDDVIESAQLNAFNENLANLNFKSVSNAKKSKPVDLQTPPTVSIDINSFIATHPLNLTCLFFGNANSGKSTLLGHILYELNEISMSSIREIEKKINSLDSPGSNHFKIILDNTKIERENGFSMFKKTVQINNDLLPSSTSLTLIDTPGNTKYFNKETLNSVLTFNPDVFTLVIDCNYDSWEKSLHGPNNQIYEVLRIISYLNENSPYKKQLIVILNKADLISWDKQRLEMIQSELNYALTEIFQWEESQLRFIPCSGLSGSNLNSAGGVVSKSKYKSEFDSINDVPEWYQGPTLLSHLYSLMDANMNKIEITLDEPFIGIILQSNALQRIAENSCMVLKVLVKSGYIQSGQTIEIHTQREKISYYGIITKMTKPKLTSKPNSKNHTPVGVHSDILEVFVKIHLTEDLEEKQVHIMKNDLMISSRKANTLSPNLPNASKLMSLRSIKLAIQTCMLNDSVSLGSDLVLYHDLTYITVNLVKIFGTNATAINSNQSLTVEIEIVEPSFALNVIDSEFVTNNIILTSTDHRVVAVGKIACQ